LGLSVNLGRAVERFLADGMPVVGHELMYWQSEAAGRTDWIAAFADDNSRARAVRWLVDRIERIAARRYPPFVILVYSDLHNYGHHCRLAREIEQALDPERFEVVRLDYAMAGLRTWAGGRVLVGNEGINERLAWAVLREVPTRVGIRLTNAAAHEKEASVEVRAGGRRLGVAKLLLGPYESRVLEAVELRLGDGNVDAVVEVHVEGERTRFPVDLVAVPCHKRVGAAELAGVWSAAGLRHHSGEAVSDADALWGVAWATPAAGNPAGHVVYGPYAEVGPGAYIVAFRMKLLEPTAESTPVADLDVFAGGELASHRTLALRRVTAADFGEVGEWQWIVLEAEWAGPPDLMETRVWWHGKARVAVDRIAVFRVVQP
ncbi:MAG: hypothetical protein H5T86_16395, partial [Armatimonadetes bacterium]|nr:hypothetical protein [Armatimonadota bacterium]